MVRTCKCAGGCGGSPIDEVSRRGFLTVIGAGAATTAIGAQAWGNWLQDHTPTEALAAWKKTLMEAAPPTVYRSDVNKDARMHLGGVGTGNFEIGCDGQFTHWQLFNTLVDGAIPLTFAVKAGDVVRLLQTEGGPNVPRVKKMEMVGEYPFAMLKFVDADLPVKLELSAFTPFAPLDSRFSSMPLAAFVFKATNPTAEKQTISLAAIMPNPIGYDGLGAAIDGVTHDKFASNVNEPLKDGRAVGVAMRAEPGSDPKVAKTINVYTGPNLDAIDRMYDESPKNFALYVTENHQPPGIAFGEAAADVVWFEEPAADLAESTLAAAKNAAVAGATVVFSGRTMPLLAMYAKQNGKSPANRRPDVLFEDFEHGYDKWKVEGEAFDTKPAEGTLPNQNVVTGFRGKSLVNSYVGGDNTTGKLTSQEFTINRNYIRFLIGGGSHPDTQIRLIVDGKVVRSASGHDDERLTYAPWDVRDLAGKKAHIEIVDENRGAWGHINVDQIEFTDTSMSPTLVKLLDELLPGVFTAVTPTDGNKVKLELLLLNPGSKEVKLANGNDGIVKSLGKGKVVVALGSILDPSEVPSARARQQAYQTLCELGGVAYTPAVGAAPSACGFGTMALAALGDNVTVLNACDDWNTAWEQFKAKGAFQPVDEAKANEPTPAGKTVECGVASTVEIPAGGSLEIPFLLAWHYPSRYSARSEINYGTPVTKIDNYYTTLWPDAKAVLREAAANFPAVQSRTESFRKTFYDSTLPYWLLDCITSQAAITRHIGIMFLTAKGEPYGWEGSNRCCQPTCTHVWGYEQSLSRLFPDIERGMRRIDFKYQQNPNGGVHNRTVCPNPGHPTSENPFVDGHSSCILKAYREALNTTDESYLKEYWPNIKRAVEYLISRDAAGKQPDGVLEDAQWNTYDQALHGVTTFMSGYYLAALRAGEEWAKRVGDAKTAERFHDIFLKGQANLIKRCWNGEYFQQDLPNYMNMPAEVGIGCMADQLIGQWWMHQLGLGYMFPKEKVVSALRSIFKYNWLPDLTGFHQSPRAFAGDGDKGLLIVAWPKGGRPGHVMLYSDEVWTGIEYQVAGHMIYEGMIDEAYAIIKGARDRYNGIPRPPIGRNPWNEIECGGHYARAMSSWALLLAASGYEYDGVSKSLRFTPRITPEHFKSCFVGPEGWGSLQQTRGEGKQTDEIHVVEGQFVVKEVRLVAPADLKQVAVSSDAAGEITTTVTQESDGLLVKFGEPVTVKAGQKLTITVQ